MIDKFNEEPRRAQSFKIKHGDEEHSCIINNNRELYLKI
jgi:hypothetical protein